MTGSSSALEKSGPVAVSLMPILEFGCHLRTRDSKTAAAITSLTAERRCIKVAAPPIQGQLPVGRVVPRSARAGAPAYETVRMGKTMARFAFIGPGTSTNRSGHRPDRERRLKLTCSFPPTSPISARDRSRDCRSDVSKEMAKAFRFRQRFPRAQLPVEHLFRRLRGVVSLLPASRGFSRGKPLRPEEVDDHKRHSQPVREGPEFVSPGAVQEGRIDDQRKASFNDRRLPAPRSFESPCGRLRRIKLRADS